MKLLLFGKVGSGKSYVGQVLQREFGIHYHDADDDLPESMASVIRAQQPVSEAMREEFAQIIVHRLRELGDSHPNFCVAQALFKNRQRVKILEAVPDVRFCWVRSSQEAITERLLARTGHLATAYYAEMVNPGFEEPSFPCLVIDNTGNELALVQQVSELLGMFSGRQGATAEP